MQTVLNIKSSINIRNTTWFYNVHPLASDEECMEPFEDIDNMTIERFYNNYLKSNGIPQYQIVVLGIWTVDIKERLRILTDEPENVNMHRFVIRGNSHLRARPKNNSRFVQGSIKDSITKRKITGDYEINWIGNNWKK